MNTDEHQGRNNILINLSQNKPKCIEVSTAIPTIKLKNCHWVYILFATETINKFILYNVNKK